MKYGLNTHKLLILSTLLCWRLALAWASAPSGPALAAPAVPTDTIVLTTTDDSLDAMGGDCEAMLSSNLNSTGDGLISLREAICAANNTPTADVIILPPGTYSLTRLGVEDANLTGDLDILASGGDLTLQGAHDPPVVIQGPGAVAGTDRVFHIDPEFEGGFSVSFHALTIQDGYAQDRGGGIYCGRANLNILDDCIITGNQVAGDSAAYGGGIYFAGSGGTLTIDYSLVSQNQAVASYADTNVYGGGVAAGDGAHVIVTDSEIYQNQVTPASPGAVARGGGIYVYFGDLTIERDSGIQENVARRGGGVYLASSGWVSVTDSLIHDNTADYGAGIYSSYSYDTEIQGSTISENEASLGGGGVFVDSGSLTLVDSTLIGNRGSGLANMRGETEIFGCTFDNNDSLTLGGAIYNQGTLTLTNSTLSGNYAGTSGGGLSNLDAQANLQNVTITDNTADDVWDGDGDGGGIYVASGSTVYLANSIVAQNYDGSPQGHDAHRDCSGALISQDYNLIGDTTGCILTGETAHNLTGLSAELEELADNGGETQTCALQSDSPAIDQIPDGVNGCGSAPLDVDQRDTIRPQGDGCEMGAYEIGARLGLSKNVTPETEISYHGMVTYTILLGNGGELATTEVSLTDTLPAEVTFSHWVYEPAGAQVTDNVITWEGTLGVMGSVNLIFAATHTGGFGNMVTNTVQYGYLSGGGSDAAAFSVEVGHRVYLPLIIR